MSVKNVLRPWGLPLACLAAASAIGAAAAMIYVAADRLDVVEKKRAVAKVVATVDRNAALNVIAKEGRWYKVSVNGNEGYVFEEAVSEQPVGPRGKGVKLSAIKGGSVPELETAAAVKGLDEGTRQFAISGKLKMTGLEELMLRRNSITSREFDRFVVLGGLPGVEAEAKGPAIDEKVVASNR